MQELLREFERAPSMLLLYGDAGVGKTRMLHELRAGGLGDQRVHWLDLGDGAAAGEGTRNPAMRIEELFERARTGDLVIADHFGRASDELRHQLFRGWSGAGLEKRLGMIVASRHHGFNELRRLCRQYRVRVQSYQQMPLSDDEVMAFLGSYLFEGRATGELIMPSPVRRQFIEARGNIRRVIEIARREEARIAVMPRLHSESIRQGSRIIASLLLLIAIAAGIGWNLLDEARSGSTGSAAGLVTAPPAEKVVEASDR